jgi:50S ribosomal subunit-associated GTPase HflX
LHRELEKYDSDLVNRAIVKVVNKTDIIDPKRLTSLKKKFPDYLFISAVTGDGVPALLERLERDLAERLK